MLGIQLLTMHKDENLARVRTLHLIRILEKGCMYIYLGQKNMFAFHILAKTLSRNQTLGSSSIPMLKVILCKRYGLDFCVLSKFICWSCNSHSVAFGNADSRNQLSLGVVTGVEPLDVANDLIRGDHRSLFPCGRTQQKGHSANQEEDSHKEPNLLAPWFWTIQFPELKQTNK